MLEGQWEIQKSPEDMKAGNAEAKAFSSLVLK